MEDIQQTQDRSQEEMSVDCQGQAGAPQYQPPMLPADYRTPMHPYATYPPGLPMLYPDPAMYAAGYMMPAEYLYYASFQQQMQHQMACPQVPPTTQQSAAPTTQQQHPQLLPPPLMPATGPFVQQSSYPFQPAAYAPTMAPPCCYGYPQPMPQQFQQQPPPLQQSPINCGSLNGCQTSAAEEMPPPPPETTSQDSRLQPPMYFNGYAEQYYQQQQQMDAARMEANYDAGSPVDNPQQQQNGDYPVYHHQQDTQHQRAQHSKPPLQSTVPVASTPRRRNGYMHNILYKTELCRDVQEKGACPRGKTCQFAHCPAELHDPRKHPLYKTAFCFDYKNRGFCPRGPHCFHVHDVSELKMPQPFPPPQARLQQQQYQSPAIVSASVVSPMRGSRSQGGRMRRRQQPQESAATAAAAGTRTPKDAAVCSAPASAAATETPFNFLMKKLQQQQHQPADKSVQPTSTGDVRGIEDKVKSLGLSDAWTLEPVRGAQ